MPTKTEQAQQWAKENYEELQLTAKSYSTNDITNTLLNLVNTYTGGDSCLFLFSQSGVIFFFNINSTRSDVRSLVVKVFESGGLIFASDFSKKVAQFIPILAIKPAGKMD